MVYYAVCNWFVSLDNALILALTTVRINNFWVIPCRVSVRTYLVGYLIVLFQEHLELADTDAQVSVRVLIGDVEAERTELTPLQDDAVEEAQRLEQVFELIRL